MSMLILDKLNPLGLSDNGKIKLVSTLKSICNLYSNRRR